MNLDLGSTIWLSIGAILVFLMIPAIGMLEAGLIRRKNVVNGLMKGLLAVMIFLPIWLAVYPIYYSGILVDGFYTATGDAGVPIYIYGFFIGVFGAVTLALIYAGIPERVRFGGWVIFSIFFSVLQWPLVSSWIWGGGFLSRLGDMLGIAPGYGVRDFAGGTVVHAYSGIASLAAMLATGPTMRRAMLNGGSLAPDMEEIMYKERVEMRSLNIPLAIIGTSLLFFGWFGFNGGSTVVVSSQTQYALANTAIAGSLAGFILLIIARAHKGYWDPIMAISGIIGGLVMITPLAGFVDLWASYIAGILAGIITYYGIRYVERYYVIDDPVGSLPVHGFNGIAGSALVPILSSPQIGGLAGIIYGGPLGWLATQLAGMAMALLFVFITTYLAFHILIKTGFRAKLEEEVVGLDIVDHGVRVE